MNHRFLNCELLLILACMPLLAIAEDSKIQSFPLADHGSIQLRIPDSWQGKISSDSRLTIELTPKSAPQFKILISPMWSQKTDVPMPGAAEIKQSVGMAVEKIKAQSVEGELPIKEIKGPSVIGYYFSATDKAPKPGEFQYMMHGLFKLEDLLTSFTVFTNDDSRNINDQILQILAGAEHTENRSQSAAGPSPSGETKEIEITQSQDRYLITTPQSKLILSIPRGHLGPKSSSTAGGAGHSRYFYLEDPESGLIVSGWFEPEKQFPGVKEIWRRDTTAWKENKFPEPQDISFAKFDRWDAVLYNTKLQISASSHLRAHLVQAGTWIDVHLSVTSKQPGNAARLQLESLLKSFAVTEKK